MSELGFAPTPLHKLIFFVLSRIDREVGAVELAKIVYLIDVEKKRLLGSALTDEQYTRQEKGPLPWHFHSAIKQMSGNEVTVKLEARRGHEKHSHAVGKHIRFDCALSDEDELIAERVLNRVRPLRPRQIEDLAYDTEPMTKILDEEREAQSLHLGEHLDMTLIEEEPRMALWRKNKARYDANPDPEYEAFFAEEMAKVNTLSTK